MERILITGGAGFIGSNLAKKLSSRDCHVYCFDNFDCFYSREQKESNIKDLKKKNNFTLVEGDIRRRADLQKIRGVNTIIHLAAKTGVRPSILEPGLYYDVNVKGTQNLLEFARCENVKRFIFASSSSVYGVNPNMPWKEEERLMPISPYASTKLSGETLGHRYNYLYNLPFVALRFFTVYGPRQRPDLAIHKFVKAIVNEEPITIFGDGNSSRDYTFIDNIVEGICAALNYKGSGFEIFNLGNEYPVKLTDLVSTIERVCCKRAIIEQLPEQRGDVTSTCADISKAKKLLGYNPTIALGDGVRRFYRWYTNHFSKAKAAALFAIYAFSTITGELNF